MCGVEEFGGFGRGCGGGFFRVGWGGEVAGSGRCILERDQDFTSEQTVRLITFSFFRALVFRDIKTPRS
jgi:hypothetical protein